MKYDRTDLDLQGRKIGKLTVLKIAFINSSGQTMWECLCECGGTTFVRSGHLNSGGVKTCGRSCGNTTHGMTGKRIYGIYNHIVQRCNDKNSPSYKDYGGRGIKCLWKSFKEFYADMKDGYADDLSIDRIDNNGNYCKENCRWSNAREQSRNTRRNVFLTHNGHTKTIAEWAEITKINYWTITMRIKRGWSHERALTTKEFNRGQKK